jgi:hypothetical protein
VAAAVSSGSYPNVDAPGVVPDAMAPLLERMAKKALLPADVGPADVELPCADTPARAALESAFGDALKGDTSVWTQKGDPSPLTARVLKAEKDALDPASIVALTTTAEGLAKVGLNSGRPDTVARAKRLCSLERELSSRSFRNCEAISKL